MAKYQVDEKNEAVLVHRTERQLEPAGITEAKPKKAKSLTKEVENGNS